MMRSIPALLLALLISALPPAASSRRLPPPSPIPASDTIDLVNTRVVWMVKTVQPGNPLLSTGRLVPHGRQHRRHSLRHTYVLAATINALTLPKQNVDQATMHLRLKQAHLLPAATPSPLAPAPVAPHPCISVSSNYDLLLDNGTTFNVTLTAPLTLDTQEVTKAEPLATDPGPFKPGTLCRDTPFIPGTPWSPGSPGTSDTVIPGSPGTPDIDIPGVDGGPDTIIPGMPATPDTVIPGTPATPDDPGTPDTPAYFCPPPPIVLTSTPE